MTPSSATTDLLVERWLPRAESAQIYEKTGLFPVMSGCLNISMNTVYLGLAARTFVGFFGAGQWGVGLPIGDPGIWGTERTKKEPLDPFCLQFLLLSFQQSGPWIDLQKQRCFFTWWMKIQARHFADITSMERSSLAHNAKVQGHMVTALNQETVDCRCISSSGSLQSLVWDNQIKRVLYTSVYYILECPPPTPRDNHKAKRTGATWEIQWCLFLCRELDGGFNSVEKYYFPKVCCENQESSKPPTREKNTTHVIYNSWFSQMLLLGICKCRFFSLENFLNFVLQEFLQVSIWPRRDGLLH